MGDAAGRRVHDQHDLVRVGDDPPAGGVAVRRPAVRRLECGGDIGDDGLPAGEPGFEQFGDQVVAQQDPIASRGHAGKYVEGPGGVTAAGAVGEGFADGDVADGVLVAVASQEVEGGDEVGVAGQLESFGEGGCELVGVDEQGALVPLTESGGQQQGNLAASGSGGSADGDEPADLGARCRVVGDVVGNVERNGGVVPAEAEDGVCAGAGGDGGGDPEPVGEQHFGVAVVGVEGEQDLHAVGSELVGDGRGEPDAVGVDEQDVDGVGLERDAGVADHDDVDAVGMVEHVPLQFLPPAAGAHRHAQLQLTHPTPPGPRPQ